MANDRFPAMQAYIDGDLDSTFGCKFPVQFSQRNQHVFADEIEWLMSDYAVRSPKPACEVVRGNFSDSAGYTGLSK